MASNNTDYAYGEVRGQNNSFEDAIAGEDLLDGDIVYISGTTDGGLTTVSKIRAANTDQPFGINRFSVKSGDVATLLLRGITRARTVAGGAIALNAAVGNTNGKIVTSSTNASHSFGANIGGALTANDTGLIYYDFIAGFCGGGEA